MEIKKFNELVVYAADLGIYTAGDLARYIKENKINTNDELYDSLVSKSCRIKNVS